MEERKNDVEKKEKMEEKKKEWKKKRKNGRKKKGRMDEWMDKSKRQSNKSKIVFEEIL